MSDHTLETHVDLIHLHECIHALRNDVNTFRLVVTDRLARVEERQAKVDSIVVAVQDIAAGRRAEESLASRQAAASGAKWGAGVSALLTAILAYLQKG